MCTHDCRWSFKWKWVLHASLEYKTEVSKETNGAPRDGSCVCVSRPKGITNANLSYFVFALPIHQFLDESEYFKKTGQINCLCFCFDQWTRMIEVALDLRWPGKIFTIITERNHLFL